MKLWDIIPKKITINNIRVDDEVIESDPQTMENRFNRYFAKVGRDLADILTNPKTTYNIFPKLKHAYLNFPLLILNC